MVNILLLACAFGSCPTTPGIRIEPHRFLETPPFSLSTRSGRSFDTNIHCAVGEYISLGAICFSPSILLTLSVCSVLPGRNAAALR